MRLNIHRLTGATLVYKIRLKTALFSYKKRPVPAAKGHPLVGAYHAEVAGAGPGLVVVGHLEAEAVGVVHLVVGLGVEFLICMY